MTTKEKVDEILKKIIPLQKYSQFEGMNEDDNEYIGSDMKKAITLALAEGEKSHHHIKPDCNLCMGMWKAGVEDGEKTGFEKAQISIDFFKQEIRNQTLKEVEEMIDLVFNNMNERMKEHLEPFGKGKNRDIDTREKGVLLMLPFVVKKELKSKLKELSEGKNDRTKI